MIGEDKSFTLSTLRDEYICFQASDAQKQEKDKCWVMSDRQMSMMCSENVSNSIVSTDYKGSQIVCHEVVALEGNGSRPSHKGSGWSDEGKMYTLNTIETHAVCYGISAMDSNAMKSSNPRSGFYEAITTRTLDINCCNPACNQGGIVIVEIDNEDSHD